jgi:hypothetical protein
MMFLPLPAGQRTVHPEWIEDCMKYRGRVLTGDKAHWCFDWDGLPVDETCDELSCCHCFDEAVESAG